MWQNNETRYKYHVGTLSYDREKYMFVYEKRKKFRGLEEATNEGFKTLLSFPDRDQKYFSEKLFPTFMKRMPNKQRPDYQKLLSMYGLNNNASPMEILKVTKGKTATDNLELISPLRVEGNTLNTDFFLEGIRYYDFPNFSNDDVEKLVSNRILKLEKDKDNIHDNNAIKVLTENGAILGFVPAVYSRMLTKIIDNDIIVKVSLKKVNRDSLPQMALYTNIQAEIPTRFLNEYKNEFLVEKNLEVFS